MNEICDSTFLNGFKIKLDTVPKQILEHCMKHNKRIFKNNHAYTQRQGIYDHFDIALLNKNISVGKKP